MDEARAPVAQGRQQAAGDPQVGADAGGVLIQLLGQVRRAGQVEAAQAAGALVAIAGEGEFDEQAQPLADLAKLVREVEDATATQGIAPWWMRMITWLFRRRRRSSNAWRRTVTSVPFCSFAEAGAQNLVALLAAQLVEELVEAEQLVGLCSAPGRPADRGQGLLISCRRARTWRASVSSAISSSLSNVSTGIDTITPFSGRARRRLRNRPSRVAQAPPVDLAVGFGSGSARRCRSGRRGRRSTSRSKRVPAVSRVSLRSIRLIGNPVRKSPAGWSCRFPAGRSAGTRGQLVCASARYDRGTGWRSSGCAGVLKRLRNSFCSPSIRPSRQALLALVAVLDGLAPHSARQLTKTIASPQTRNIRLMLSNREVGLSRTL